MENQIDNGVPTKAKLVKDIDAIIKETQVKLIVEITENNDIYGAYVEAIVSDIEYLKRVKEALK